MNIKSKFSCCKDWDINIPSIHRGLFMAAANGTSTKLTKPMEYCPWCGKALQKEVDAK